MTEARPQDSSAEIGAETGVADPLAGYSKDYWDQVLEQLGKNRLFKLSMVVLALMYASAIYAPLLANDRPFVLEAADYGEYGTAQRTLYPVTLGLGRLVKLDSQSYLEQRTEGSTQTFEEALRTELTAVEGRVETLLSYLPAERTEERDLLDRYLDGARTAVRQTEAGEAEAAQETMSTVKDLGKRIRAELVAEVPIEGAEAAEPAEAKAQAEAGDDPLVLQGQRSYPLFESLGWAEIFFMVLWLFVLSWPLWNAAINRLWLGRDRERVRRARRLKWAMVLGVSALAALGWRFTVNGSATFATAPYKSALTSGEIVATSVVFPPVTFGFAETNSGEYFRPPTWKRNAEIDEIGYYVHGARVPQPDAVTGALPEPAPVEVRYSEPERNAASRHWLGTDSLGRDLLVRALYGGRISLSVGLVSAAILVFIGTVIGAVAGYFGGWVDLVLSRLIELLLCFPAFFLILMVAAFTDPAVVPPILMIVVVIGLVRWTGVARLARGEFLKLREQEFVIAAQALGLSPLRTIFRHILPNAMGPVLVSGAFAVASGILTESGLSFLGFGVGEPVPSWGALVNNSRSPEHWWIIFFPGVLIFITVTCYNLVGEAIRDAVDPRLKD